MSSGSGDFTIDSLRGGLNDNDPPMALRDDQCQLATNVEFNLSTCGEKRRGCTKITLPAAFADVNLQAVTFLHRYLPTSDETASELWAMAQHLTTQHVSLQRKTTTWSAVSQTDAIDVTNGNGYQVDAQDLHGKLFLAYRSVGGVDRQHVWDGASLRRTGLAQPVAPAVVDTGAGGAYTGTRYVRVRYLVMSGSQILLRSEPSVSTTFGPSGSKTGLVATKPASISEGETHWELELSTDNANFYRTQTLTVATTTATDTTAYANGYATTGVLSADIGDYSLIPSVKFLCADQDRLLMAGSFENAALASRVSWTPVFGDTTGVGNDERIPITTNNYLDLDGYEGGAITGMSDPVGGYVFVFKWSHLYKLVRTGTALNAYAAYNLSKTRGALPKSIVEGMDSSGQACLYFLDPKIGPCRLGANGLQACGQDVLSTWRSVNINATVVARALYYPDSRQVHWWVATNGSSFPNAKIVLQTNLTRDSRVTEDKIVVSDGVRCGWSTSDNRIAQALATCLYADNIDANVARSMTLRPFIGLAQWTVGASTIQDFVQRCDTGDSDGWTTGDTAAFFRAFVKSKPFTPRGILNKFGIKNASLMATAVVGASVTVRGIRDFGLETKDVAVPLDPTASETIVIKALDNFSLSELKVIEIEMGELDLGVTPSGTWRLHQLAMKPRTEETS